MLDETPGGESANTYATLAEYQARARRAEK